MTAIEVNLTPEAINQAVAAAVVNSGIGKKLQDEIKRVIDNSWKGDSIITAIVEQETRAVFQQTILTEYRPILQEKVRVFLSDKMTDELIAKMWEAITNPRRY